MLQPSRLLEPRFESDSSAALSCSSMMIPFVKKWHSPGAMLMLLKLSILSILSKTCWYCLSHRPGQQDQVLPKHDEEVIATRIITSSFITHQRKHELQQLLTKEMFDLPPRPEPRRNIYIG